MAFPSCYVSIYIAYTYHTERVVKHLWHLSGYSLIYDNKYTNLEPGTEWCVYRVREGESTAWLHVAMEINRLDG